MTLLIYGIPFLLGLVRTPLGGNTWSSLIVHQKTNQIVDIESDSTNKYMISGQKVPVASVLEILRDYM